MRRIKLIVALGVVMAAMLALSAGPAMADEWNDWDGIDWDGCGEWNDWDGCDHDNFDDGFDEVIWLNETSPWYDQLCSPGLPEGVWIPGCIFSDPIEEEHVFDDAVFVIDDIDLEDIDFDDDCDCDDDDHHFRKDDRRFHDDWRFRDDW